MKNTNPPKIIWCRTINQIKNIEISYSELEKKVDKIIKNSGAKPELIFSIFNTIKNKKHCWNVQCPDIDSKIPVYQGKCNFESDEQNFSIIKDNPTWRDIILAANSFANGDHIYLESLEITREKKKDGTKYIKMVFGS